MQQLLIVAGVLIALPFAAKLLWKLYLFPLVLWLTSTRLIWPKWAEAKAALFGEKASGKGVAGTGYGIRPGTGIQGSKSVSG